MNAVPPRPEKRERRRQLIEHHNLEWLAEVRCLSMATHHCWELHLEIQNEASFVLHLCL
jgi:hypothetical protein